MSLIAFKNNKAVEPSKTLWSQVKLKIPECLISIESSLPSDSTTTAFFFTDSVDRIATLGWLIIGEVKKELNDPLFEIVNVLPETSSREKFFSLNFCDNEVISLDKAFTSYESDSLIVPTSNPSWFISTAIPKSIFECIVCESWSKSKELFTTGYCFKASTVALAIKGR